MAEPGGSRAALIRSFAIRVSAHYGAREAPRLRWGEWRKILTFFRAGHIDSVWDALGNDAGAGRTKGRTRKA